MPPGAKFVRQAYRVTEVKNAGRLHLDFSTGLSILEDLSDLDTLT